MAKLAKNVYGEALFELAVEEQRVDEIYEAVCSVKEILEQNRDLTQVLSHPKVVKEEKIALVKEIFTGRVPNELTGLLVLLVEKNHTGEIIAVLKNVIAQIREYKNIGIAYVLSAVPLEERQKESIEKRLLETTHYQQFEMNYDTDPSLIGGLVIRVNDRVIDSSIKTRLHAMKKELLQIQVSSI